MLINTKSYLGSWNSLSHVGMIYQAPWIPQAVTCTYKNDYDYLTIHVILLLAAHGSDTACCCI